mmetsp:Transcript_15204/g.21597  ORF Transcript_15204/g.21597 Transcript_15204/m.21597 type:complete len:134 (-) Transcript_15204:746-1147(-)
MGANLPFPFIWIILLLSCSHGRYLGSLRKVAKGVKDSDGEKIIVRLKLILLCPLEDVPFADCVTTKYPWNKTDDTPELNGIPPDVALLVEVQSLKSELAKTKEDLKESFKDILVNQLDSRKVGGTNFMQSTSS